MPILELEFEVFCGTCGAGLCNNTTEGSNKHSQYIQVEACENCLEEARGEGEDKGYNKGYEQCQEDNGL